MILPSDSDPPPGPGPGGKSGAAGKSPLWWQSQEKGESSPSAPQKMDQTDSGEEDPVELQSVAPPGWREALYKDLLDSLRDIREIEDPDDEFSPPEPPDLYTFFGELAALRHDLQKRGLQTGKHPQESQGSSTAKRSSGKNQSTPAGNQIWSPELCLSLISLWDLLPADLGSASRKTALHPLLEAANLQPIPAVGLAFDPAWMTLAGEEPAPPGVPAGVVLREISGAFRQDTRWLRPASVIVGS